MHTFSVGKQYTRNDIYKVIGIPEQHGGPWDTGYARHGNDYFVFCGIGTPGRTGHDHGNHFEGDELVWFAKSKTGLQQPTMQAMLHGTGEVYIFFREEDRAPFTFAGVGKAKRSWDESPVKVLWSFADEAHRHPEILPEEIADGEKVPEGAKKSVTVNVYERDPNARAKCINRWGCTCSACGFDFAAVYGSLGNGFIHVHHLKPLAEIGEQYQLDPLNDLRPVCPNCHAMLHRTKPAMSIEALKALIAPAQKVA